MCKIIQANETEDNNWVKLTFEDGSTDQTSVEDGHRRQYTDAFNTYMATRTNEPGYKSEPVLDENGKQVKEEIVTTDKNGKTKTSKGKVLMHLVEIEKGKKGYIAPIYPTIEPQFTAGEIAHQEEQEIIAKALQYLKDTDWVVLKAFETNTEIPSEIKEARAQARIAVGNI